MVKRLFLFLVTITFIQCQSTDTASTDEAKPNVLLLFADDQTFHSLRSLGNAEIHTPNLDRLVASGTTFTRAYNQGGWHGAVCVASRSMMISGLSLWESQHEAKRWQAKDSSAMASTWGHLMRDQGYRTYMTGKWHVAAPADEVFGDARHIRPGMPGDQRGDLGKVRKEVEAALAAGKDISKLMPVGYNRPLGRDDDSWLPSDTAHGGFWEGGQHWSEVVRNDAIDFLEDAAQYDDPFFMYVAFNAPHDPRQAPQEYIDMYPVDEIAVPKNFLPQYPWMNEMGSDRFLRDEALAPFPRTPYAVQKHRQEYYAIITHLDAQVGKILDALDATGRADDTYIFFTADHGLSVGQHGLIGKQNMYEHSMRVPLMISGPDIPAGKKISDFVYLQDVMATGLEVAGAEPSRQVYFNSLLDLANGKQEASPYPVVYGAYRDRQRMVRDDTHKMIMYPTVPEYRLFDLKNDPLEMKDLSDDPAQLEKCQELFSEFLKLQTELSDTLELRSVYPELL